VLLAPPSADLFGLERLTKRRAAGPGGRGDKVARAARPSVWRPVLVR
jgi:hypothetical protein